MDTRVIIFWEKDFPFIDTAEIPDTRYIIEAMPPMQSVRSCGIDDLKTWLNRGSADMLINPYGSAFPREAWEEIHAFLSAGGSLLNIGGSPFSVPVARDGESCICEEPHTIYQNQLGISAVTPVGTEGIEWFDTLPEEPLLSGLIKDFRCKEVFELQMALTEGPRVPGKTCLNERTIRPMMYAMRSQRRVAAPVISVDHFFGPFAGGRWVLANFSSNTPVKRELMTRLTGFTALGISDFHVRPSLACYYTDERPTLIVQANRFEKASRQWDMLRLSLTIKKEQNVVYSETFDINDFHSPYYGEIRLRNPLSPGLYVVEAHLTTDERDLTEKYSSYCVSGFWCCDDALIQYTQPLTLGKQTFVRGDKPSLMVGASYSSSDTGDDIFSDPNPALWERDFDQMDEAGVNLVHVGFKSEWERAMPTPGVPSEEVLRAATTLMLTAARHDMSVVFTLFKFSPSAFKGTDAFYDRRSLMAQKEFVGALSRRLSKFNNILWNIIDEPMLPDEDTCRKLGRSSQEVFKEWVSEMADIIKQNKNKGQRITVGFSNSDPMSVPSPWLYGSEIDFSSVHSSGQDANAVYSIATALLPDKPSIILESGSLAVDGSSCVKCESEETAVNLLERKLVTAYAFGASGAVEWLRNVNSPDPSLGSTSIGMLRSDGCPKPGFDVIPEMRAFLRQLRPLCIERQPADVSVVVPISGMTAEPDTLTSAAHRSIQIMQFHLGFPVRAIGDHSLKHIGSPRLIVLPSPGIIENTVWKNLLKVVEEGSVLLVTGLVDSGEKGGTIDRLAKLGIQVEVQNVNEKESLMVLGRTLELDFSGRSESLRKTVVTGTTGQVKIRPMGNGTLIYAPMPFESANNVEPTIALYEYAAAQAAIQPPCTIDPSDPRILVRASIYKKAVMYALVSYREDDCEFMLSNSFANHSYIVNLPANRAAMFLADRNDGHIIAQYGNPAIKV